MIKLILLSLPLVLSKNYFDFGENSGLFDIENSPSSVPLTGSLKVSKSFISAAALTAPVILDADYLASTLIVPLSIGMCLLRYFFNAEEQS